MTVDGTKRALVEIAEQLAWLSAALRLPESGEHMSLSVAQMFYIFTVTRLSKSLAPRQTSFVKIFSDLRTIDDNMEHLQDLRRSRCWHLMFQNPVVVCGFPILAREFDRRGLEVQIDAMVKLGNADYLTSFDGIPVLKGFSTMFVATGISESSVQWHFLSREGGERISYLDAKKHCSSKSLDSLSENAILTVGRNFVGWATSIERIAGKLSCRTLVFGEILI